MKTKSNRIRYKELELAKIKNDQWTWDIASIGIAVVAIFVYGSLFNKTVFDDPFLNFFIALFMVFIILGSASGAATIATDSYLRGDGFTIKMLDLKKFDEKMFGYLAIGLVAIAAIQFGFNVTQSITNVEQFLFYVFAAVAEEYFYRFFLTTAVFVLMSRLIATFNVKKKIIGDVMAFIISATISTVFASIFFYVSHISRYGGTPMILMGIFLASVVLTSIYVFTKNLLICLIIHLLINFIAFGSLLITV